ncbi:TPA: efflux RND transporter permease subunit [Pseudomonas aeruginosa]|nr:efflux RND transporter permease subunit [Pseudomonas aeruginosa]
MSTQLSSWAIRRPIPTILLFVVLCLAGWSAFVKLPVNANPQVTFPVVTVSVGQPGAAPSELENAITRRIESAVAGLAGVRHITSVMTDGQSHTTVEFQLGIDPDRATNDVRDAVTQVRSDLPQGIEEPIIAREDVEGGALFHYAVKAPDLSLPELSWFIDDTVSRTLLASPGVQQVKRLGGIGREIRIELLPERLEALGITAVQVNEQLVQSNVDVPGGRAELDGQERAIRALGAANSVEALAGRAIALPDGRWARLSDLARVTDGGAETRTRARLNGHEVVGFSVFRARGSSDTVVAEGVEKAIAQLQAQHSDIRIEQVSTAVDYTRSSYSAAMATLLEGAALTVLVVFLFLRSWRATLVAAIALPLSILPTFAVMALLDYTLNSITLLALTLVIGILVDDAIVEIENIERHLDMGKRPFQASIDAADAIGFAVVAITATIVAVFLPVSFIGGAIGQYFSQFGVTVSAAVLASLLVARLGTPLLAAYLLAPKAAGEGGHGEPQAEPGGLLGRYLRLLKWALAHRRITLLAGGAFLAASLAMLPLLPTGFLPVSDRSLSQLDVTLPPGTPLAQTDARLQAVSDMIVKRPEVASVFVTAGGDDVATGLLLIRLKPAGERALDQKGFEQSLRQELGSFADMRFAFRTDSAPRELSVILTGDDPQVLSDAAHALRRQMRDVQSAANVQVNEPLRRPELRAEPRLDEASRLGISPLAIGTTLRIATVGDLDANSARFNFADRQVPVRVALQETTRNDLGALGRLRVAAADGTTVPLHAVANLRYADGDSRIERFDRQRRVSVDADLVPGYTLGEATDAIQALPALQALPEGVRQIEYGDTEYMAEMFDKFGTAMGFGVLMVFVVLVLLFKDFLQPITILTALPLSLGGALGGLLIYGGGLDLPAVIGILMLMGIVTKNSILLVDFVIEKRRHGMARAQALVQSGAERARPIIMTTIAMAAGMVPAVFSSGADSGFRAPMAIAVIGGLLTSTLLSLVFVPVFYSLMDDLNQWLAPKLAKLTSVTQADREEAERSIHGHAGSAAARAE